MRDLFYLIALKAVLIFCMAPSPLAAQNNALPPLTDEIAAQFTAIGRFGQSGFRERQGCTATLIAPDLVVTAAHCASPNGTSERVFVAGWSRGDYIDASGTQNEIRHPAYATNGPHDPRNDIALIVLRNPIENVPPIPLSNKDEGEITGTQVALIGYHRQTPHLLSGDFTCPITDFSVGLFQVGCPVINGNSGSPVLNQTEDGTWQIVGVVSSQFGATAIVVDVPDWLRNEVANHLQLSLE